LREGVVEVEIEMNQDFQKPEVGQAPESKLATLDCLDCLE